MPSSAWKTDVCSRSEEHTSELQSQSNLVCRLLVEKKKKNPTKTNTRHTTQHKRTQHHRLLATRCRAPTVDSLYVVIKHLRLRGLFFFFFLKTGPPPNFPLFPPPPPFHS